MSGARCSSCHASSHPSAPGGTRVVSAFQGNGARGIRTVLAASLLTNPETGASLAVPEGGLLTGLLTGAASGVATKALARPAAATVGCFGAGFQTGTQFQAVGAVRPIRAAAGIVRRGERALAFSAAMTRRLHLPVRVPENPEEAAAAGSVVAATTATSPARKRRRLRPGAHVNAIRAFTPDMRELDTRAARRARVVADTREGTLVEAGEPRIPMRARRFRPEEIAVEIRLFKSIGFAMDAVGARLTYAPPVMGVGQRIDG